MIIEDLLDRVLLRVEGPPACSIYEAVREVTGIISARLLLQKYDLLLKPDPASIDFLSTDLKKALPADFLVLAERPYIVNGKALTPLNGADKALLQTTSTPCFYEVVAKNLWLYPPTDAALTVKVAYFYKPPALLLLTDTLPFDGEFDAVFVEGCLGIVTLGLAVVASREFVATIQSQVDALLAAKAQVNEQLVADAINDETRY